jgi:two-component system, OmpR family, sensor histidine kinase ChvG
MRNQAVLVREIAEHGLAEGIALGERESIITAAARQTRTRIRILDATGREVADSHREGPPEGREPPAPKVWPDDLADIDPRRVSEGPRWPEVPERPEVRNALSGHPDAATRIRQKAPSVLLFLTEPVRHGGLVRGVVYVTRSTQPVLFELYRIRRGLIQLLLVALAFTVLVSASLAWTISRPLSRLARAARRIAGGERGVEVPVEGSGEIRELAEAFRVMTDKLDARLRYISEFSADVAHEFKSPLTAIRGAAELLGEGAMDDPVARQRFLGNIQLDAERLDRLVSRLLELSRLESSREPMGEVNLEELIARVVERTHSPDQPVVSEVPPLVVQGRAGDIERALLNLVENALRFSPPGEPVRIAAEATAEGTAITVRDRGPGIPDAHRERIFERFFTTDAERSGTGLGLAIVKAVAEAHGGTVTLGREPGKGAVFRWMIPRR